MAEGDDNNIASHTNGREENGIAADDNDHGMDDGTSTEEDMGHTKQSNDGQMDNGNEDRMDEDDGSCDMTNDNPMYNMFNEDCDQSDFNRILPHRWQDGSLIFWSQLESGNTFCIPFSTLCKDAPVTVAKYIKYRVVEQRRRGYYGKWSETIIKRANNI